MSPTFVFVHGFGCERESWRLQVEALAPAFDVVTLDLPGHGQAPLPDTPDLTALARAVVQAKARCAGPVLLVGHSMGCRVALEALRLSPRDVAGLAFIDGSATGRPHAPRLLQLLRDRLRLHGMRATLQANVEEMFTADSPAALREAAIATALRLDPLFAEQLLEALARWDATDALAPLVAARLPVLSVQATTLGADMRRRSLQAGETSPWGRLVQQMIPTAWLCDVAGVGHFVHLEAAHTVNEALVEFGRRCSTAPDRP